MNESDRNTFIAFGIGLGFVIIVIGTYIALPMPNEPPYAYGLSYGYGLSIDVIGCLILFISLMMHFSGSAPPTHRTFKGKVCGDCYFFGREDCKRQEKLFNAMPCEEYTP